MIKFSFYIILLCFLAGISITIAPRRALETKLTLGRLLEGPSQAIKKIASRVRCRETRAFADMWTDHQGKDNPGSCSCPDNSSAGGMWNNCLSCLFVQFVEIYNEMATRMGSSINPETNGTGTYNGMTYTAEASTLTGYSRHVIISRSRDSVCLNLHYAKSGTSNTSGIKVLLLFNPSACDSSRPGDSAQRAMAMKFDVGYTSTTVQEGYFINTEKNGSAFDLSASGDDALFYLHVNVNSSTSTPVTETHVYRLAAGSAWKFFVQGQDDSLFATGHAYTVAYSSTNKTSSDLTQSCFTDTSGASSVANSVCQASSYTLSTDAPVSVSDLASRVPPTWTTTSPTLTATAGVESYF